MGKKSSSVNECVSLKEHSDTPQKTSIILTWQHAQVIIHGGIKFGLFFIKKKVRTDER